MALDNDAVRADQNSANSTAYIAGDAAHKQHLAAAAGSGASNTVRVADDSAKQQSSGERGCSSKTKLILAVLAAVFIIGVAVGVGLAVGLPKKGEPTLEGPALEIIRLGLVCA
jgi:hypothetical protein